MTRVLFVLCTLAAPAAAAEPAALRFRFQGLRSSAGVMRCALYNAEQDHMKRSFREVLGRVSGGQAECVFPDVPRGRYSIGRLSR
jgi:uncharacterized protein (DUF2141 family)